MIFTEKNNKGIANELEFTKIFDPKFDTCKSKNLIQVR